MSLNYQKLQKIIKSVTEFGEKEKSGSGLAWKSGTGRQLGGSRPRSFWTACQLPVDHLCIFQIHITESTMFQ